MGAAAPIVRGGYVVNDIWLAPPTRNVYGHVRILNYRMRPAAPPLPTADDVVALVFGASAQTQDRDTLTVHDNMPWQASIYGLNNTQPAHPDDQYESYDPSPSLHTQLDSDSDAADAAGSRSRSRS